MSSPRAELCLSRCEPGTRLPSEAVATTLVSLLLGWLYWPTLQQLQWRWEADPSWSHGYLVAPAFLWIAHGIWKRSGISWQPVIRGSELAVGVFALLVGLSLHEIGRLRENQVLLALDGTGLILVLLGIVWMCGGRLAARTYSAAVLFLMFMVPLPFEWQQPLAECLQSVVTTTSHAALLSLGVPVHKVGYLLLLPGQTVEVAEGCSGLRQITVFVALSVFLGLNGHRRGLLISLLALSIPVAIIANTLRITVTGLILVTAGPAWAKGFFHELEGLVTFGIGLALLIGAARLLDRWGNRLRSVSAHKPESAARETETVRSNREPVAGVSLRTRLAILTILLSVVSVADGLLQRTLASASESKAVALTRSLADFPLELGEWSGADTPVERDYFLYGDEHLHRMYRNRRTGQTLTLWMIYTDDGRDRAHHPEACMRAIGCSEMSELRAALPVDGDNAPVQRFFFRNADGRNGQHVYHWYYVFRERAPAGPIANWQDFLARLPHAHSGISVEVFAPSQAMSEAIGSDAFVRDLDRALHAHLPEPAVRGSSRGSFLLIEDGGFVEVAHPRTQHQPNNEIPRPQP